MLDVQLPNVHWDENAWIIRGNRVHIATVATCVDLVVSNPLLVDLGLDLGLLKGTSLPLVIADVGLCGRVHCLDHSRLRVLVSFEDLGDLHGAEVALLDLARVCQGLVVDCTCQADGCQPEDSQSHEKVRSHSRYKLYIIRFRRVI